MNLFFDCESNREHKTPLISIGIVSESGKTFYAEFENYSKPDIIYRILEGKVFDIFNSKPELWKRKVVDGEIAGHKIEVAFALREWLKQFDYMKFISDGYYDFMMLIDLLHLGENKPSQNKNLGFHNIDGDIASYYGISDKEAMNRDKETIILDLCGNKLDREKHNAMYDAKVIKKIYECIQRNIEIEDE